MCPSVENPDLVLQKARYSQSPTHSRLADCSSRQTIKTRPDYSNRVVSPPKGLPFNMLQVAPTSDRTFWYEGQQQTDPICVTSTRPPGLGSGCTQLVLEGSGPICLSTGNHLGQSGGEVTGMQENHSDCSRVAQHALVLGSSGHVKPDPIVPAQSGNSAIQSDSTQESVKPKSICLAPRASAIKEQGFSVAVAALIMAPQRGSTRSVYEAKWTIFTKWCLSNKVDFRSPPVKFIADFLLYLFQDRKLQPSTIRANAGVRSMLGKTKTSDTSLTGQRCLFTLNPAFFPRTSWPKRVRTVWPQWLSQPWPQLWISHSSLIGLYVQSEHCDTIWTGR